jgi:hypothetical protein
MTHARPPGSAAKRSIAALAKHIPLSDCRLPTTYSLKRSAL